MIERYTLYETGKLRDRFHLSLGLPRGVKPSYNRRPNTLHPVIVSRDQKPTAERMLWGLLPKHAKNTNSIFRFKTYSVKSDAIFAKATTSELIRTQRCLVPVNGFYMTTKTADGAQTYYITRQDKQLFSLAGVYDSWTQPDGVTLPTFSIVTCEANDDLESIDARMPVLVHPDDEAIWTDPTVSDATSLYDIMRPCPNGVLSITLVDSAIATTKKDTPDLIRPVA